MKAHVATTGLLVIGASLACAATYVVNPQGTGDFPTIQAAMDAVVDGDVIELTDGAFTGEGNREIDYLGKQVTLRSQSGEPSLCIIDCEGYNGVRFSDAATPAARLEAITITQAHQWDAAVFSHGGDPRISGCIFLDNALALHFEEHAAPRVEMCLFTGGEKALEAQSSAHPIFTDCEFRAASASYCVIYACWPGLDLRFLRCTFAGNMSAGPIVFCGPGLLTFQECTFAENAVPADEAVIKCVGDLYYPGDVVLENSILAFNAPGASVATTEYGRILPSCCDVYGNEGGDYIGPIAGLCDQDGNISADPLFCAPGDYAIHLGSPCSGEEQPLCGRIGAHAVDCDGVYEFACCLEAVCEIHSAGDCLGAGGVWLPGTLSCDPNPCSAACCLGELCEVLTAHACADLGGEWLAERATCDFNPCDTQRIVWPDGLGEYPTIQAAIEASNDGDTVLLADGLYTGIGNRAVSLLGRHITVTGESGDPTSCLMDCQNQSSGFLFDMGETRETILSCITVANATAVGAYCREGYGTFLHCIFADCGTGVTDAHGGSRYEDCVFHQSLGPGAYLSHDSGDSEFSDCVFSGNQAGAVSVGVMSAADFQDCLFLDNHSPERGGAVFLGGMSIGSFTRCIFGFNSADLAGGAVSGGYDCAAYMESCTLYGNAAPEGSGIFMEFPNGSLQNTIVAGGSGGAGVQLPGPGMTFFCCDLYGNEGGDWIDPIASYYHVNGNISEAPELCNPHGGDYNLRETSPCAPFTPPNPACALIGAGPVGCNPAGVDPEASTETQLSLTAGSQSPLGPGAPIALRYELPATPGDAEVTLRIYAASGRLVRTLLEQAQPAGQYQVYWDGRDETGGAANRGIYFCRLCARGERLTRRLVLLK